MAIDHNRIEINALALQCGTMTNYLASVLANHDRILLDYKMCKLELAQRTSDVYHLQRRLHERDVEIEDLRAGAMHLHNVVEDLAMHLECAEVRAMETACDLEHEIDVHTQTRARLLATQVVSDIMATSVRVLTLQREVAVVKKALLQAQSKADEELRVMTRKLAAAEDETRVLATKLRRRTDGLSRIDMKTMRELKVEVMHAKALVVDLKCENNVLHTKLCNVVEARDTSVMLLAMACKERDDAVREASVARELLKAFRGK